MMLSAARLVHSFVSFSNGSHLLCSQQMQRCIDSWEEREGSKRLDDVQKHKSTLEVLCGM